MEIADRARELERAVNAREWNEAEAELHAFISSVSNAALAVEERSWSQHIVVVDDAATNLEIISAIVGDIPDAVVHPFVRSSDAMSWAFEHHVDAFVLDYNMPDPDGLAMIGMLRADPRYQYVPIVVLTAAQGVRRAARRAGCRC